MAKRTKAKTLDQIDAMKRKAVRFLRDVLGDDRAAGFEAMSPEEYAGRKRIQIANPSPVPIYRSRRTVMPKPTRVELEERIRELEEENDDLGDKLDSILDIASDESDDDGEEDGERGLT